MSQKKKQQPSHEEIQALLKQEVAVSQEILSQLTQQEYLLLIGELEMKKQIEEEIKLLTKQKDVLIEKRKSLTLDAKPLDPVNDAEFLLLIENSTLLTEKISDQINRNEGLTDLIQNEIALEQINPALHPQMLYDNKASKPIMITLEYPDQKPPE